MLQKNFQAIFDSSVRDEAYLKPKYQRTNIQWTSESNHNSWYETSGVLDLVGLIYPDQNFILGGGREDNYLWACNRGNACILRTRIESGVNPVPDLEGYVSPKPGHFAGRICYIWDTKYFQALNNRDTTDLDSAFKFDLPDMFQKIYGLQYVLQKSGLILQSFDGFLLDLNTEEVLLIPEKLSTSYYSDDYDENEVRLSDKRIRDKIEGRYEFKPHPEMKQTVTHYELPEISKDIPAKRIDDAFFGTHTTDEIMCLISAGKITDIELIQKYAHINKEGINISALFEVFASNVLPFIRKDEISVSEETSINDGSFYTYQRRFDEAVYANAGTHEKTKLMPYDELSFEYLFDRMLLKEFNRNRLAIEKDVYKYYKDEEKMLLQEGLLVILTRQEMIQQRYVSVNGIQFSREDLRVFSNTLFYNIVEYSTSQKTPGQTGSSEVYLPYLAITDLKLIRDFLKGRIMIGVLYQELSEPAYQHLSGKFSLLEMSEIDVVRDALDASFTFGLAFIEILNSKALFYRINNMMS